MATQSTDNQRFTNIRLPTSVKPSHYELTLEPDLEQFIFKGSVKIDYKAIEPIDQITLHSVDLKIIEGYIISEDVGAIANQLVKVTYSSNTDTATLEFDCRAIPVSGQLFLHFTGILNDQMVGFYRTSFKLNNRVIYAATTHFEPVHARKSFPCWDEPALKATFSVSLITKQNLLVIDDDSQQNTYPVIALSNMPPDQVMDLPDGKIKTIFQKTPIMSTYLLAYIVGPFEMVEGSIENCPVRVFSTPGKKEQGRFALEVACKSLDFYQDYFGIAYQLPKMDLVAIPDFKIGAMENWGLLTYRESLLLAEPGNTATAVRHSIALVVAHEIAHQWFGNLVTMKWWTDLWLKEGFAKFMEYLCIDRLFPEYDMWSQFVTNCYTTALDLDSLRSSHPIEVPVEHPSEIEEIFDVISYRKGASVLRMLYNYIGEEHFRQGLKEYLTTYSYSNANTKNLWESLEAVSGKPVSYVMNTWTSQKGYPWISVDIITRRESKKLTINQNKFSADGDVQAEDMNKNWKIPLDALINSKLVSLGLLEHKTSIFSLNDDVSCVKLNVGSITLCRVAYPEIMLERLIPNIMDQTLSPMDRLGILDDNFALCQAGKCETVSLLKLLEAYKGETHYSVWRTIDKCIAELNILISFTDYQKDFHSFTQKLYENIFKKLTWQPQVDEHDTDSLTRSLVIERLVSSCEESVIEESKRRFKAHTDGTEIIPADLRSAVYKAISIYGDKGSFEQLFKMFYAAEKHEEKNRIAIALGATQDSSRLQQVIEFVLSEEVRSQDKVFVLRPISKTNSLFAWNLFKEKKDFFREMYGYTSLLTSLVKFVTENFASEDMALEISSFFYENEFLGTERTVQQSLETVNLRASWLARDSGSIAAFLTGTNT